MQLKSAAFMPREDFTVLVHTVDLRDYRKAYAFYELVGQTHLASLSLRLPIVAPKPTCQCAGVHLGFAGKPNCY